MKLSTERILTTHVGSLPRSQEVVDLLFAQDRGDPYDASQFNEAMREAELEDVKKQIESVHHSPGMHGVERIIAPNVQRNASCATRCGCKRGQVR